MTVVTFGCSLNIVLAFLHITGIPEGVSNNKDLPVFGTGRTYGCKSLRDAASVACELSIAALQST